MKLLRLLIVPLSAGVLAIAVSGAAAVAAQDKQQTAPTDTTKTTKTPTGFPTGTTCTKSGVFRADNKYLEVILVVGEGEIFPPFVDGQKTTWYALESSTKSTFDAVKVSPGSN